jgi:hypothetical protein
MFASRDHSKDSTSRIIFPGSVPNEGPTVNSVFHVSGDTFYTTQRAAIASAMRLTEDKIKTAVSVFQFRN